MDEGLRRFISVEPDALEYAGDSPLARKRHPEPIRDRNVRSALCRPVHARRALRFQIL